VSSAMSSGPTAPGRRSGPADAARVPARVPATALGMLVRSRWRSAADYVRAQCAADPAVPWRRGLQLWLGLIWLLDAALQYQPFMFRPSFVTEVIEPAAAGNPDFVIRSVDWASQLMLQHVALYNAAFATVQLLIAGGLFVRRAVKPALALSIIWALSVWWFGESLGGILAGASPLAGVPGAVLLYALTAVLIWPAPPRTTDRRASVAAAGPTGAVVAAIAWIALWSGLAHYLLRPANRAAEAISGLLTPMDGQPAWLAASMSSLSRAAAHHGLLISVVLASLCVGVALGILARPLIRPALALAAALAILFWVAQGLGGVFTGQGTDPNTGPLLILLAACYLPGRTRPPLTERS
jgi:hypothetical protein